MWLVTGYVDTSPLGLSPAQLTTVTPVITLLSIPYLAYALIQAMSPGFLDLPPNDCRSAPP